MSDTLEPDLSESRKVRVLSPDDEQTRLIGKAIASETAGKILSSIGGREVTAMVLSDELHTPVSTVMYHLENLASAGLIEVSRTRYSVKGREMKVYRLVDQVLIVSPKKYDLKSVLTRCATLLSLPLGIACILTVFGLMKSSQDISSVSDMARGGAAEIQKDTASYAMERAMEVAPAPMATVSSGLHEIISPVIPFWDLAAGILIGALLVILTGLLIDYLRQKI